MTIRGKASGVPWWIEPLGRFPWALMESLGRILKVGSGFSLGFALGKSLGAALRPLGRPLIFSQYTALSTLGNRPRGSSHHDKPSPVRQIVLISLHNVVNALTVKAWGLYLWQIAHSILKLYTWFTIEYDIKAKLWHGENYFDLGTNSTCDCFIIDIKKWVFRTVPVPVFFSSVKCFLL